MNFNLAGANLFSGAGPFSFPSSSAGFASGFDLAKAGTNLAPAAGAAATGLGAALGPIGWAGLGMQAIGSIGSLFGGQAAAKEAEKQMKEQRQYMAGANVFGQELPRFFDYRDTKREIALANSPGFRQAEGFTRRQATFDKFAGKYSPALARLYGSFYG